MITLYQKFRLKSINYYIVLLIFLSIFKNIYCQKIIRDLASSQNQQVQKGNQEYKYDPGETYPTPGDNIDPFGINSCFNKPYIDNYECFNNIIIFNQKKYQLNNFAANKNGDILIQYNEYNNYDSENSSRLFYGLTKNGSYFFSNKSSFSHEFNISVDEEILEDSDFLNLYKIQDSKSMFISIKNDINKKSQYLFSINSYNSLVELYDLNNNNNNYIVWSFNKFFNLDSDDYYFPFEYELFELKEKSEYIIAFIPSYNVYEDITDVDFIKKFIFKSFDNNAYEELKSINYEDFLNTRIINIFLLEESKTLVILTINETIIELLPYNPPIVKLRRIENLLDDNKNSNRAASLMRRKAKEKINDDNIYIRYKFNLKFYNQNLKCLTNSKEIILGSRKLYDYYRGEDLFIKSLNINFLNKQYVLFFYYIIDDIGPYFVFELYEINLLEYKDKENIIPYTNFGYLERNIIDFDISDSLNDFIKLNNEKVVFMYMTKSREQKRSINNGLAIIIIDVNIFNERLNAIDFYINLDDYIPTQIKGFEYNSHLLFSATCNLENYYDYYNKNSNNYFSIFMAFGYMNGTDHIIDIIDFLNKENHEGSFINFIYDNFKIENNIFGYEPLSLIKLVSFPKELSLYIYDFQNNKEMKLSEFLQNIFQQTFNPYFDSNYLYIQSECSFVNHFIENKNENCPDFDYIIRQNTSLIKTSKYYYIDYQNFLEDTTSYMNQRGDSSSTIEYLKSQQIEEVYRRLGKKRNLAFNDIYPGRINRIKFKLCHEYCETCYELDTSENQKCISCLSKYQHDYFYYSNRMNENPNNICVPEGKYYDTDSQINIMLIQQIIIKKYVFQMRMNIHALHLIQFIILHPKNVFIVILSVLKKVNVQQKF